MNNYFNNSNFLVKRKIYPQGMWWFKGFVHKELEMKKNCYPQVLGKLSTRGIVT